MDISLDEYICQQGIKHPDNNNHTNMHRSGSKFDRYNDEDGLDDEMTEFDEIEKPKLVPFKPKVNQTNPFLQENLGGSENGDSNRKSIHRRLGNRQSVCESIHTSRLELYRPNFKPRTSIQHRLNKNFVTSANVERNRITLQALTTFTKKATQAIGATDEENGRLLIDAISAAVQAPPVKKKYDMRIQKEICEIQEKELYYTCPGANVVSFDGPGIQDEVSIPQNETSMTLNQRFA